MKKLLPILLIMVGCNEFNLTEAPSSVDVTVNPGGSTEVSSGGTSPIPASVNRLVFDPPAVNLPVGTAVSVKVTAMNRETGQEVPGSQWVPDLALPGAIQVGDTSVSRVKSLDGRFIAFESLSVGTTEVEIQAAGAIDRFTITYTP